MIHLFDADGWSFAAASPINPASMPNLARRKATGFTLIELLVVISIIALLMGILLPVLSKAREVAKGVVSMSNLHQIGIANAGYLADHNDFFMNHEATYVFATGQLYPKTDPWASALPANERAGTHWEDHLVSYMPEPKAFLSPLLTETELAGSFMNYFAIPPYGDPALGGGINTLPRKRGGYGYNIHYLGFEAGPNGFNARMNSDITSPGNTVFVGDTAGTRNNIAGSNPTKSYALEPPLPSLAFGAKLNRYYKASSAGDVETPSPGPYDWLRRAYPAPRNAGTPAFLFCDGHATKKTIEEIDDFNNDGVRDNGYWNGKADPTSR